MKKIILFSLALLFLFSVSACATPEYKESTERELYKIGLELISVMDEMLGSKEYAEIMASGSVDQVVDSVDTNDYDSPVAVYRITLPKSDKFVKITGSFDEDRWNSLSPNLQKQIEHRFTFSAIANIINSAYGSTNLAFSSLYTAYEENKSINIKRTTVFLYIFEEGTPIAVTFSKSGGVNGQFVFLDGIESLSDVRTVFEPLDCSVKRVDID